ncbi:MAG: sensor histidine kinase [Proteobacteria bacterium]|nr:sensor histidine kinase [Pseudomonadota bacterium]
MNASGRPARYGPTLRLRLTAVATALLATGLILSGALVYLTLDRTLSLEVDRALADRARVVIASITVNASPDGLSIQLPDVDAIAAGGAVVQVTGFDGTIVRSASLGRVTLEVSRGAQAAAQRGQVFFETVTVEQVQLRVHAAPLVWRGDTLGVLLVARPLGPTELVLGGLQIVLIGVGGIVLIVCAILAWVVARGALRPIDDLAREAGSIGADQDFNRRLSDHVSESAAEVGRLATTFNAMLDRLQDSFAAVQRANSRLEAMLQSQRRFVADASHELRTPLTTIRGNAHLMARGAGVTEEDTREMVTQISSEADRMSRLVTDLLTLARADAGLPIVRQPVMLRPLLESVGFQARTLAAGRLTVSVVPYTGDGDLMVEGDPDALRQLVLARSVTHGTPRGSADRSMPPIQRPDQRQAPPTVTAQISVIDTGVGIGSDDLPHVFERFYRADRARHTTGSGLGLAIARWIADAHEGTLAVESSLNAGSMFTVSLPATVVAGVVDNDDDVTSDDRTD